MLRWFLLINVCTYVHAAAEKVIEMQSSFYHECKTVSGYYKVPFRSRKDLLFPLVNSQICHHINVYLVLHILL